MPHLDVEKRGLCAQIFTSALWEGVCGSKFICVFGGFCANRSSNYFFRAVVGKDVNLARKLQQNTVPYEVV